MANIQKRRALIRSVVEEGKPLTQKQIAQRLFSQYGMSASQTTIHRDLDAMGYKPGSNGEYALRNDVKIQHQRMGLATAFRDHGGAVVSAFGTIAIMTKPGFARSLCAMAKEAYGESILGCIAGDDTVILVVSGAKREHIVADLGSLLLPSQVEDDTTL